MEDVMNVYDFDGTIYDGDATVGFVFYTLAHHPGAMLKALPKQIPAVVSYLAGKSSKTELKSGFFVFQRYLKDIDKDVKDYWDKNQHKIKAWYLAQQRDDDVIISASAEFLLQDICNRLGIRYLIATRMDKHTGEIAGKNCKGAEKPGRFYERFPQGEIDGFYSDHDSDRYMARLAKKSYLVRKNTLSDWQFSKER